MRGSLLKKKLVHSVLAALVVAGVAAGVLYSKAAAASGDDCHVLIADQFNNRVIEVDRRTHQVVWHFGNGSDLPGPHSVVGVNDAERFGPFTLISGN